MEAHYLNTLSIALGAKNAAKAPDNTNGTQAPSLGDRSCESQMIS